MKLDIDVGDNYCLRVVKKDGHIGVNEGAASTVMSKISEAATYTVKEVK